MTAPSRPLYRATDWNRRASDTRAVGAGLEYRKPSRRDYARLVHAPAFRRLQGKTQLFPGFESDFFRTRLTHSLEVAQVAKSLALRLNTKYTPLTEDPLDLDLIEFAALAHDIGHPPFGHNGEDALDKCMREFGGFEGNAQTFRIVARLEKKRFLDGAPSNAKDVGVSPSGADHRAGLNLTARSLAAVLKYDEMIPLKRSEGDSLVKGYYASDLDIVRWVKKNVCDRDKIGEFKTIECQVMDLADDIAYSTYDLEDTFKSGLIKPLDLLSLQGSEVLEIVAGEVAKKIHSPFSADDAMEELLRVFGAMAKSVRSGDSPITAAVTVNRASDALASSGYIRTDLTSQLVGMCIDDVEFVYNSERPYLSTVRLSDRALRRVETFKKLAYNLVIMSSRLKVAEYRGSEIVTAIFDALAEEHGRLLLPPDVQLLHSRAKTTDAKMRTICDFIAGMTDAYAIDFYARLKSENPRSLFRPL